MMQEIIQGDARDLVHKLEDNSVKCAILDPPYGVAFKSLRAETASGKRFTKEIANDGDLQGAIDLFHEVMIPLLHTKMTEEAEVYVFTRWDIVGDWIRALDPLAAFGLKYKMLLVWDKGIPGMGDIDSNWGCGHELILYCKRGLRQVPYRRSGIIAVNKLGSKQHVHPTEKPVGLMEALLAMSTNPGDLIVDPFAGSGSSLVAAKRLGRRAVGFELDEGYYRMIEHRLGEEMFDLGD
jgi:site-specific DNA-methyltransferase (adenine-specific)